MKSKGSWRGVSGWGGSEDISSIAASLAAAPGRAGGRLAEAPAVASRLSERAGAEDTAAGRGGSSGCDGGAAQRVSGAARAGSSGSSRKGMAAAARISSISGWLPGGNGAGRGRRAKAAGTEGPFDAGVAAGAAAANGRRIAGGFDLVVSAEAGMRVVDAMMPVATGSDAAGEGWASKDGGSGAETCAATAALLDGAAAFRTTAGATGVGAGGIRAKGSGSFSATGAVIWVVGFGVDSNLTAGTTGTGAAATCAEAGTEGAGVGVIRAKVSESFTAAGAMA